MLTTQKDKGLLVFTVSAKLTQHDIDQSGTVRRPCPAQRNGTDVDDARDLERYTLSALWVDLNFDATHRDKLGPMVVVSEEE
ncbi:MAG: hypothetical protein ACOY5F_16385 [Pseudomonadota bacterium]